MTNFITRTEYWADRFKAAYDNFDEQARLDEGLSPVIVKAQKDALKAQELDLRNQIKLIKGQR